MAYITKATAQLMRDLGSIQSPQNAFLLKSRTGDFTFTCAPALSKCTKGCRIP